MLDGSLGEVLRQESKRHAGRKKGRRRPVHADSAARDAGVQDSASKAARSGF